MVKLNYKYQKGETVNNTLKIVDTTIHPKYNSKAYVVQSLAYPEAPTYTVTEVSLNSGTGCAYSNGKRIFEGNSVYSLRHLRPYIVDLDESKTIPKGSSKHKIKVKCTECGNEKMVSPSELNKRGFFCEFCSNGISYPENFLKSYLKVKNINYEYQKSFKDLPNRRFDFFLPESNTVIETHGIQHYKKSGNWDYKETKKSDEIKENYCKTNNIRFVKLNCSQSSFNFIQEEINNNNFLESISNDEVDLILKNIEEIKNYPVKEIVELHKEGNNTREISLKVGISQRTILNILNRHNLYSKRKKRVRCRTTEEEFDSISDAQKKYNAPNISRACKSKKSFSGRHPETGKKLKWEFIED